MSTEAETFERGRNQAWEALRQAADDGYGVSGVEKGLGLEPMMPAIPVNQPDAAPLELSREENLNIGANQLIEKRPQNELEKEGRSVDVVRQYFHQGGAKHGEPMPDNEVVSAQQASHDLSLARQGEAQAEQAELDRQLAQAIDHLRTGETQQPAVEQQQPQIDQHAQPEVQPVEQQIPQAAADDPVVRALQENPALLDAVNKEVGRHHAYAEQARIQYEAAMAQNATAAVASLVAQFPELAGIRGDQIPTAISVVQKQDPKRAEAMVHHIALVRELVDQHQKAQAANVQKYQAWAQQQFQTSAKNADAGFEEHRLSQGISDEQIDAIQKEALAMLREYGASDKEIAYAWNNNPAFRSLPAQKMMLDAARYRMAQRGAAAKVDRSAPVVQRPGSPLQRGSEADYTLDKLNDRLNRSTGREALRAAAELVTARRARRR